MIKKLISLTLSVLMVLMIFGTMFTASALPYSKDFSDCEPFLASLEEYATAFPDVEDYTSSELGAEREGMHLANKDVVMPAISDESFAPVYFSFAESTFGCGVDYTFATYSKDGNDNALRFIVYYNYNDNEIPGFITPEANNVDISKVYTGKMGGYDYIAFAEYDDNGDFIRTVYKVALDDKLAIIYSADRYTTEFAESISFEDTGISLPVYENDYVLPEVRNGYNRYFFLMPENWYNEYTDCAGIYWWEGTDAQISWPGLKANRTDAENVYYYDVPEDVRSVIWNNNVSMGMDLQEVYKYERLTINVGVEYYEAGESDTYPDGLESFDGMIYVIDPDKTSTSVTVGRIEEEGEWYYYYGEGEYGTEAPEVTLDTLPEVKEGCNRYFFYMPDYWYNEYAYTAGIYWWDGTDACTQWPGYKLHKADAPNIYYYDVPKDVEVIIWNNYLDGGSDKNAEEYYYFLQTKNIDTTGYEVGESDAYPDGLETFDGMIYVIDPSLLADQLEVSAMSKILFEGEWYYYYGDGRYGLFGIDEEYRSYRVGDTDDDFRITVKDATCIQKHLAGLDTKFNPYAADANEDERINIKDATAIQKNVAGLDYFSNDIGDIRAVMI